MTLVVYRPAHLRQINPEDPLGPYSCTAYSAAIALDRLTLGGVAVDGWRVRQATGLTALQIQGRAPRPGGSTYPGFTLDDVSAALAAGWDATLHVRSGGQFPAVLAALAGYQGVILQGHYPALTKAGYGSQPSFTGDHAVYVNNLNGTNDKGLMYDPLAYGYRWVPLTVLHDYATQLQVEQHASGLFYATTRRTPLIDQ